MKRPPKWLMDYWKAEAKWLDDDPDLIEAELEAIDDEMTGDPMEPPYWTYEDEEEASE